MSKLNIEDIYQLSPGQQGMLTVVLLSGSGSEVYFDQSTLTLSGELDVRVWRRAWQRVLDRHPALRTLFVWERQGEPLQVVRRQVELPWQELDLSDLALAAREARLEDFLRQDRARGFDLGTPPLMRLALVRWEAETWKMVWSFHHLIVDGWSLSRIFGEAVAIYAAFRDSREPDLEPPRRYRDYIAWLQRQDLDRAENFWRGTLAGFDEPTPLPYDGTGLGTGSRTFGRELSWIPPAEAEVLSALARRNQLTLNTLFQGAWGAVLARTTGRDDVIFGSVVSGRPAEVEGIESVVGFFINVLPVRLKLGDEIVGTALADLQRRQVEQRDFEYCPLESIQAWSALPRGSRQIESLLVFQNLPLNPLEVTSMPGFRILSSQTQGATHYPVTLYVAPRAGGLDLRLDYHLSRLDAGSAGQLCAHLRTILAAFAAHIEVRMAELPLITAAERRELLARAAGPAAAPAGLCIHTLFEEQAARTPEAPAVEAGAISLTYRELAARAEGLARRLRRLGVGPESIVGLCVERSPEMVVGMLGVLKAGGVYLPLDPVYPRERLAFMLEDSGGRVLLTQERLAGWLPAAGRELVLLDVESSAESGESETTQPVSDNGAYIIYTSGSTGRPKGVLVSHAALVSYVTGAGEDAGIGAGDRVLQFASMSFDTSAEEIYPCLTRGATLVLRDDAMAGPPESFLREVERLEITVLDLPTAYWHELVAGMAAEDLQWPACVRLAILGGEQAQAARLDVWRQRAGERCRLLNTYGPTEATIVTTRRDLERPRDYPAEVPIGRPVPGARVHVVSRSLELLPAGLEGELAIGGAGLARGYLGRPGLTAERFVPDPFSGSPGERLYRTGDLARWLRTGELEFRGRTDHQVKVRGFRIELGEIETALRGLAGVREAVAVVREEAPGERRIVAYVVPAVVAVTAGEPAPSIPSILELRTGLRELLPDHMLPAAFVTLETLPLTPSGKVDRRALPAPSLARPNLDAGLAPRNPVEELVAGIWAELLGASGVAPHDSFFDLGGHSLLATRMISRVRAVLGVDLPMLAIFEQPTLAGFAALAEQARQGDAGAELPPLLRVPRGGPLLPSFSQQRIWFLARLEPESFAYNLAWAVRLAGPLDVAGLAAALTGIVRRHESLRTTFDEEDGQPLQAIAEPAAHPLPVVDLASLPEAALEEEALRIATAEARRPYDLALGPLVRSALLRLGEQEHALLAGMHHVVSDGWSMGIFVRELGAFYRAFAAGRPAALPELTVQYADFAVWQRQWLSGEVLAERLAWWTGQLGGAPQVVELPLDRPRPAVQSYRGRHADLTIGGEVKQRLETMAPRLGATPFMLLLAGFATLLSRYGDQTDVVVGTPIANRGRPELEDLIGFFANTLALRVDLSGDPGFGELVRRVREMALGAYAHQDVPFERLVDELRPERSLSHSPVFQVTLVLQNLPPSRLDLPGLILAPLEVETGRAQFDLSLFLYPRQERGPLARLEYASDLFDAATIQRLLGYFHRLLAGAVAEGGEKARLDELPLMGEEEREQVLHQWNDTATAGPREATIPGLFAEQVRRTPEAPAVVCGDEVLSYAELDRRASRLARRLHRLGVGPESLVAIFLERSPELVVAALAALKAGGAYLPIDPAYPGERALFILRDSGARVVLTVEKNLMALPELPLASILRLDEDSLEVESEDTAEPFPDFGPDLLAYVIYTSGSTGAPKGTELRHGGLSNLVTWHRETYGLGSRDRSSFLAGPGFDASIWEMWPPLAAGATLLIPPAQAISSPYDLLSWIARQGITVSFLPTPLAEAVLAEIMPEGLALRVLLTGGDRLHGRPSAGLPFELVNHYGPTECTVVTTAGKVAAQGWWAPDIGTPIANTRVHLLDSALQPVPVGIPGELCVGGEGLARGYRGRSELTAERFVPNPFARRRGERLYRTGDLARRLSTGGVEFLGRLDRQVKIRGFRIELGEIESALAAQPAIAAAAVVLREDRPGDKRLVAYVVPRDGEPAPAELRQALARRLPDYMVPAAFMVLKSLPLTPNGKLDRRALPAPSDDRSDLGSDFVAPRNPVEEALAAVWAEVLHREGVGIHDNFFELGGDSIRTIQVVARSRKRGIRITPRDLFKCQTIAELAEVVEVDGPITERASEVSLFHLDPPELDEILAALGRRSPMGKLNVEEIYPLSPSQQGMLMVVLLSGQAGLYFDRSVVTLGGELDVVLWRRAWQRVVDRHPSLRTLFVWEGRERPLQVVCRQVELPWEELDWSGLDAAQREARLDDFLRQDSDRGFDLGNPPLMRFALIRWDPETWKMVWSFHHLIVDGWSLSRIFGEAVTAYAALRENQEPALEPPIRYRDYIAWLQGQDPGRAEAFWRGALAGVDEPTPLPYDGTGVGGESWSYGREMSWMPPAGVEALSALARRNQLTLNTLFQGAWGALLAGAAGRDDVVFGSVVSGRPGEVEGIESVVGFFINVLPVRLTVGNEAMAPTLADLQRRQVEQRDFEHCPLESIQASSGLLRGARLIESLLVFQNLPLNPLAVVSLPGFRILDTQISGATHYPLTLYVAPRAGGLDLRLDYHVSRFDAVSARRLLAHLETILEVFTARPGAGLAELSLITAAERLELLARAAGPAAEPAGNCIHTLFERQAALTPEAPAVEAGASVLTYRELEARAESLARRLRRLGVGPESIVGLCVERSPGMVVGMLAVLKAGGVYLPLDPVYPRERLAFMLEDSGARVLLTQESLTGSLPATGREVVILDVEDSAGDGAEPELAAPAPLPGNGAYVIYTSGSTGRPKGVIVPHASLVSYVRGAGEDAGIGAGDRVLQFASMSFDTSAEEIYPCLARGATLVLRDDAMAGPAESFLREVERLEITVLDLPTAYWHELVDGMAAQDLDWPACARLVILGGELAQAARLDIWRQRVGERCRLLNTYGPTEATIVTTRRELSAPRDFPATVPIGRPVPGARVHVVSRDLGLLPAGLDGEVVIGGAGLARGYLGRPDLTADRFVPDPFAASAGERLYRTGDLARWLPAGELEFRGRADHQVKVRGYRIELGEVEAALRAVPTVRDAAAVAREALGGGKQLVAFVVPREGSVTTAGDLRVELQGRLPEFMVPSVFTFLPELPLTPSGKVDRRALERIEAGTGPPDSDAGYAAPRNQIEEMLCGIWSDLLGVERLGIHDNFFQLGGHSLLVARLASRVRQAFGAELSMVEIFKQPTVAELALLLQRAERAGDAPELPPIRRAPRDRPIPLSFPQERVWFLDQLSAGGNIAYNFQVTVWFEGPLDAGVLRRTLTEIVRRHEVLRTSFPQVNGQPVQVIHPAAPVDLPVVDLRQVPAAERPDVARQLFAHMTQTPFDLSRAPLIRWRLLRLADDFWELHQVEHHFVHDGWSFAVMLREIKALYAAFLRGEPSPLAEPPVQYADFATWQHEWMAGPVMDRLLGFWTRKLAGAPHGLELATDRPRPARNSFAGSVESFKVSPDLYSALRKLSRREGFTLYMTMLAGFFALLQRYTGELDAVIGTSNANRRAREIEDMIGMVVNSLLLRGDLSGNPTFRNLLGRVRELCLEVYAHQDMPFERLVQELRPKRQLGRNPLFQIMYNFHDSAVPDLEFGGLRARFIVRGNHSAKMDMNVIVIPRAEQRVGLAARENDSQAVIQWEYNTDLFDRTTILRMVSHYETLLAGAVADIGSPLAELPLLTDAERHEMLAERNQAAICPQDDALHCRFAAQAARTPDAVAVSMGDQRLTYCELERRANRLAHRLRALGVGPETPVPLCVERSPDLVIGILGILKAGGGYVPIDPSYPAERIDWILEDSQAGVTAPVLVTQTALTACLPASRAHVLCLDAPDLETESDAALEEGAGAGNLAYIIYTSGSTGRPKGVPIRHGHVVRLFSATDAWFGFGAQDIWALFHSFAFDFSVWEVWGALLHGGRLVVVPYLLSRSPEKLYLELVRERVTVLNQTPSAFRQLVEAEEAVCKQGEAVEGLALRYVVFGGEALELGSLRSWFERHEEDRPRLINMYGITETTVHVTYRPVTRADAETAGLGSRIGRPIPDLAVHLLDPDLNLVPVGVPGEIHVGGAGLSSGYLNRPGLTAERFIPDPFVARSGARLYRSGDLARMRAGGDLEYLGRRDHQVKVRGFRIELGEIEAALIRHPALREAVVLARFDGGDGETRLVAYLVAMSAAAPTSQDLRQFLKASLPEYMIPSAFVVLEALPLTPHGKVDRKVLPAPEATRSDPERVLVAPRSSVEETLAAIWSEVLGVERVGVLDDFFLLGGHSLSATRVLSRVRDALGVNLPLVVVFETPTIEGMADAVSAMAHSPNIPPASLEPSFATDDQAILARAAEMSDADLDALLVQMITEGGAA